MRVVVCVPLRVPLAQAERYDDMVQFMNKLVNLGGELSVEERNLLSVAYKNVIGSRRESLRTLAYLKGREEVEKYSEIMLNYRNKIEAEVRFFVTIARYPLLALTVFFSRFCAPRRSFRLSTAPSVLPMRDSRWRVAAHLVCASSPPLWVA